MQVSDYVRNLQEMEDAELRNSLVTALRKHAGKCSVRIPSALLDEASDAALNGSVGQPVTSTENSVQNEGADEEADEEVILNRDVALLTTDTYPGRKIVNLIVIIPYVFNVGMIPAYLLVKDIGLIGHLPAVFLPGAISTYNCIIMRQFFVGIPMELKESARIDGCTELQVMFRIILPLSKAIVMTIGLFYAVSFWNDFFHAMLYLNDSYLNPLPIFLRNILIGSGMNENLEVTAFAESPINAIKAASVFMSAIPMVIAYPFIQKYFTKGTLLGSVKG